MRIERIEASKHKKGRVLIFLEDGACLKVTEQELLDFQLHSGDELSAPQLTALKAAAGISNAKTAAAELIGRRAMSRRDLERKLRDKGAAPEEAAQAADWLTDIGALDDAAYAAMLVRHCGGLGYGPARTREKLYEKGVPRAFWEEALRELPPAEELIDCFLERKLRGKEPEEKEKKRLTDALLRRGFSWGEIRSAWRRWGSEIQDV